MATCPRAYLRLSKILRLFASVARTSCSGAVISGSRRTRSPCDAGENPSAFCQRRTDFVLGGGHLRVEAHTQVASVRPAQAKCDVLGVQDGNLHPDQKSVVFGK